MRKRNHSKTLHTINKIMCSKNGTKKKTKGVSSGNTITSTSGLGSERLWWLFLLVWFLEIRFLKPCCPKWMLGSPSFTCESLVLKPLMRVGKRMQRLTMNGRVDGMAFKLMFFDITGIRMDGFYTPSPLVIMAWNGFKWSISDPFNTRLSYRFYNNPEHAHKVCRGKSPRAHTY